MATNYTIPIPFFRQKHILELENENLLASYLIMLLCLEKHIFRYSHIRKNYIRDLSKLCRVEKEKVKSILSILVKHGIFVYKYDKVGFFNEKYLCYEKEIVYNEKDNIDCSWDELIKELEN